MNTFNETTWKAQQAHNTLVKGGARRCDADEIYQLILDGNSFEDAICNYALGWLRDEVADIWTNIQNDHTFGESLSSELVFFMVAFVADEEIEKMKQEIARDHEWIDDLVWSRLFTANTWVSYDKHIMKYFVYTKASHDSIQSWMYEVPFQDLKSFPKRAERGWLDIDDYMASKYKEVEGIVPNDDAFICGRELGNGWTSHIIQLYRK